VLCIHVDTLVRMIAAHANRALTQGNCDQIRISHRCSWIHEVVSRNAFQAEEQHIRLQPICRVTPIAATIEEHSQC